MLIFGSCLLWIIYRSWLTTNFWVHVSYVGSLYAVKSKWCHGSVRSWKLSDVNVVQFCTLYCLQVSSLLSLLFLYRDPDWLTTYNLILILFGLKFLYFLELWALQIPFICNLLVLMVYFVNEISNMKMLDR